MKKRKLRVGILFGGQSAEHEVSLQSAKNVIASLDRTKYEPVLIGIDKEGKWHLQEESQFLLNAYNPKLIALNKASSSVALTPWKSKINLQSIDGDKVSKNIDVIFPVLHGPLGEDGTIQGLLKLAHIPFVGAGVLGSAVGMDKDVMKRLLHVASIPIARFIVLTTLHAQKKKTKSKTHHKFGVGKNCDGITFEEVIALLGLPFFVKPANLGSSVGVSKVHSEREFYKALEEAFLYDAKILIEQFIDGRELECAVLGNENPKASVAGEIIPTHEFYSYDAKYIDENGAQLIIPADLSDEVLKGVSELAVRAFTTLCCEGMARVDFFLAKNGKLFVNELNTIPGFTKISMYPKLWEATGVSYTKLIDQLIQFAIERFEKEQKLKTIKE